MAHAYSKLYNIPSTGLRFFTVYGPAGRPDMAYFGFTNKLLNGETIKIFNYGNCKRDFTYVDDIVEGVVRVMQGAPEKKNGEDGLPIPPYAVYNIGNNHPENLLDFVQILQEELIRAKVLPLIIIFLKEKNLRNLCMLLCIAISVASTKRTGTIALILGILVMLVLDAHIQGSLREKWKKYMYLFIAICIGSGAVLYLENRSGLEIFDRFSKLSTDGGSGRDIIWAITLQAFKTSNIREKIFGHGFQSVYYRLKPGGFSRFSHNSYIEYLYDYGIIGLSLLVLFVLSLIIIEIKFIREKNKYAPVMGMLLIITIFLSAFSYFFEESNIIQPIAVAYGIILGQAHKERKRYEN